MFILEAILLGIIQGLTEFLPVSSSAHLLLTRWIFQWPETNNIAFDISVHLGTLLSVIWYFRDKIFKVIKGFISSIMERNFQGDPYKRLSWLFILSSIPAALAGAFFEDILIEYLRHPLISACSLIFVGLLLFLVEKRKVGDKTLDKCNLIDAAFIGFAQTLALVPGVSRSGITITAGLFRGLKRGDATEFSFLMAVPIIAGGGLLHIISIFSSGEITPESGVFLISGFISSVISGYIAIKFLLKYLQKGTFYPFVYYRWALGLVIIFIYILRAVN